MNKDFQRFQLEFIKWQRKFGLMGYKVYFKYEELDNCFADINVDLTEMVATVRYNSNLPDKDKQFRSPKDSAKHEALHLLVSRLELNGRARYINAAEMYESAEELVRKLEVLIDDGNVR